jgi:uncharacterized membrane protein
MNGQAGAPEHQVERLVFFSDAVFAIAITLLVIEIHVPTLRYGANASLYWWELARLIPNFIGFVVSFFVIGAFWVGHHRAFAYARRWDPRLTWTNLHLLFAVAAMPFFTAFMSRNSGMTVPSFLYCAWLFVTGYASLRVQRLVLSDEISDGSIDRAQAAAIQRRAWGVMLGAASGTLLSLIVPVVAQAALITIPLWRRALDSLAARRSVRVQ